MIERETAFRIETTLERPRLIDLVERPHLAQVTTIVAGAGFGKTTLARQWARQSTRTIHWCDLRHEDNEPNRLLARLIEALDSSGPPVAPGPATAALERRWHVLFEDVHARCLVIDNVHALEHPGCHLVLERLLTHAPPELMFMLISRRPLPVRLGRMRALGRLREIDANHLRFTRAEALEALGLERSYELSADRIEAVIQTCEGWITGIRLSTRVLRYGPELERLSTVQWSEHDRFLDDYVREEIVEPLDPEVRQFLFETADLPFLTADLCNAVRERNDSEAMLHALRRDGAFLSEVPGGSTAWRHLGVVGGALRRLALQERNSAGREMRRRRAAEWLVVQGLLSEAAELALGSSDDRWMTGIVEPWCRYLAERSDFERLSDWLERLPSSLVAIEPSFGYWSVIARLGVGRIDGVRDALIAQPGQWNAIESPLFAGRLALCQGMLEFHLGNDAPAYERLRSALAQLPEQAIVERLYAATMIGKTAFRQGADDPDIIKDAELYAVRLPLNEQWAWRTLGADRGNTYALRGELSSAITKYRMMLLELTPALEELEGFLRCRLIDLYLERNELELANQEYETVELLIGRQFRAWHHDAALVKARLLLAAGQRDAAEYWATSQIRVMRRRPGKNQLLLLLARIWLERGDFAMVRHWLDDVSALKYPWIQTFGEINHQSLAIDLDLAQGRFRDAAAMADRLAGEATASQRVAESIAFLVRAAIAHMQAGNRDVARRQMRAALEAGIRGGFVRSFIMPGVDVVELFGDVWKESKSFQGFGGVLQRLRDASSERTISTLTKREVEVLYLVSLGRSNQQIANAMFISSNTVRNHLVNICRRLQANSRSEAVAIAREIGILD